MAKLIQAWLDCINDDHRDKDFEKVPQLRQDVIKYAKHFYLSKTQKKTPTVAMEKLEAGFIILNLYQRLDRKCNSRREIRVGVFQRVILAFDAKLEPQLAARLKDYVKYQHRETLKVEYELQLKQAKKQAKQQKGGE